MLRISSIALMALLTACSSVPIAESEARPIPPGRVHEAKFVRAADGLSKVVFLRDKGMSGSACDVHVYIDNTLAFTARPGEGVDVFLESGEHFVRMDMGAGLCPAASVSTDITLKAGEGRAYRLGFQANTGLSLVRLR